jgi:hypothetical protein
MFRFQQPRLGAFIGTFEETSGRAAARAVL